MGSAGTHIHLSILRVLNVNCRQLNLLVAQQWPVGPAARAARAGQFGRGEGGSKAPATLRWVLCQLTLQLQRRRGCSPCQQRHSRGPAWWEEQPLRTSSPARGAWWSNGGALCRRPGALCRRPQSRQLSSAAGRQAGGQAGGRAGSGGGRQAGADEAGSGEREG